MLKPRYGKIAESISDFRRMLDGMNKIQPLEKVESAFDDDLLEFFQDEQALYRLEQQIEHVHRAAYGSGMPLSEAELDGLKQIHAQAAATYQQAADKARAKIQAMSKAHDAERLAKMKDLHDRFRRKAQEHQAQAKTTVAKAVGESRENVRSAHVNEMRRLAGIDVQVQMPRDPGVVGTTRFNSGYADMSKPFTEDKSKPKR